MRRHLSGFTPNSKFTHNTIFTTHAIWFFTTMCKITNSTHQTTVSSRPLFACGFFSYPFLHPCSSINPTVHHLFSNHASSSFKESISTPKHCKGASTSPWWFGKSILVVSLDWFLAQALLDKSLSFSRWSLLCKYHTKNAVRKQWKQMWKMATGKELDELIHYHNKENQDIMWKSKIVRVEPKAQWDRCQWRRRWRRYTALHRLRGTGHWAHPQVHPVRARIMSSHSLVPCTFHSYSHWLKFEPCPHSTHDHHHGHPCGCLFDLTYSTFYFQTVLLSFFLLSDEQQPELNKKIMKNLRYSATNGGEGTYDVLYLTTSCALRSSRERRGLYQVTKLLFHDLPWIFDTDHLIVKVHP